MFGAKDSEQITTAFVMRAGGGFVAFRESRTYDYSTSTSEGGSEEEAF